MAKASPKKQKVVIIGCGNVAWHLAKYLAGLNTFQLFVYNHKHHAALNGFKKMGCRVFDSLDEVMTDADYYLVAVADDAIARVETKIHLNKPGAIIMHTSGSAQLNELGDRAHESAVFYPLQTFSVGDDVNWKEVPVIIEADNEAMRRKVAEFAGNFSKHIQFADYTQRLKMHLAAVIVNNFTNALVNAALGLLGQKESRTLGMKTLLPLLKQTVKKLEKMDPAAAQTGPAKRGDHNVIEKHLEVLGKKNELRKVYKQLTKLIEKQQKAYA